MYTVVPWYSTIQRSEVVVDHRIVVVEHRNKFSLLKNWKEFQSLLNIIKCKSDTKKPKSRIIHELTAYVQLMITQSPRKSKEHLRIYSAFRLPKICWRTDAFSTRIFGQTDLAEYRDTTLL